jgi:WD40 repeat protein
MVAATRQPEKLRVFISYSRRDSAVADALVDALDNRFDVTIDRRDLPFGEKWQAELADYIRLSDTVIWLISEASVQSNWVNWELDEVAKRNKRLVPVMVAETARDALPRQIGEIHILPAEGIFDLARDLDKLVSVLETDQAWLKQASRLLDRATEWHSKARTSALLMSSGALADAERWNALRPAKAPAPAQEVLDLLLASRQSVSRRQRLMLFGAVCFTSVAIALSGLAYWQRGVAIEQRNDALRTQSLLLASIAQQQRRDGDPTTAMLLALEAMDISGDGERPYVPEAEVQLEGALRELRELVVAPVSLKEVKDVAFSPDGKRFSVGTSDAFGIVWDSNSGRPTSLKLDFDTVSGTQATHFSPNGKQIAIASWDRVTAKYAIRLFDSETGVPIGKPIYHDKSINNFVFSKNGRLVLAASEDGAARLWDLERGALLRTFQGHKERLTRVVFSPDSRMALTGSWDNTARLWDVETGRQVGQPLQHQSQVWSVAWSPDGRHVATASGVSVFLWDIKVAVSAPTRLDGHLLAVNSLAFSPDGRQLATGSSDKTVKIWQLPTGNLVRTMRGHTKEINSLAYSRDGSRIITGSSDGTARIWYSGPSAEPWLKLGEQVNDVAISPDGRLVVAALGDRSGRVWDATSRRELLRLEGHSDYVASVGFSPDSSRIVTASSDSTIRQWDVSSGRPIGPVLAAHTGNVFRAVYSPDGKQIASSGADGTVRLWDTQTGQFANPILHRGPPVRSVSFSSDGKRLVIGSTSGSASVWDVNTGRQLGDSFAEHRHWVMSAAFSPDGSRVVSGGFNNTLWVWDPATGRKVGAAFMGHSNALRHTFFTPDGTRIISAGLDGTVRIWSIESGKMVGLMAVDSSVVVGLSLTRDGKQLVSAGKDEIWRWDIATTTKSLIEKAVDRAPRCLTDEQRESFFIFSKGHPSWCLAAGKWPARTSSRNP